MNDSNTSRDGLHFSYLAISREFNPQYWRALDWRTGLLHRKAFSHVSGPREANNVPLKADLVHISNFRSTCRDVDERLPEQRPISFGPKEAEDALRLEGLQEEVDGYMEFIRGAMGIGSDGWTSHELYVEAMQRCSDPQT